MSRLIINYQLCLQIGARQQCFSELSANNQKPTKKEKGAEEEEEDSGRK